MGTVVKTSLAFAVALLFVVATLVKIGMDLLGEVAGEEGTDAGSESRPNDNPPRNPSNAVQRRAGLQ